MADKNYFVSFDEYDVGRQYFHFTDKAKKQIVTVVNDTSFTYVPFFSFVIKYLIFNKQYRLTEAECRQVILRYAILFCYVAFKKQLGKIDQFEELIKNMSIETLFQSVKETKNPLIKIYNNGIYKDEFFNKDLIPDSNIRNRIHKILINDHDYFALENDAAKFDDNRTSFDLMVCRTAFNGNVLFDAFEIEFENMDKYIQLFTNGQKANFFILGCVFHTIIANGLSNKDIIKLENRVYYRIANIGNTNAHLSPSYITLLFDDEENNKYKFNYSVVKEDLYFKHNKTEYKLTNKGLIKIPQ